MARKSRDIETLLVWAFRDQKVEQVARMLRPAPPRQSAVSSLGDVLGLGTRVDTSSAAARQAGTHCHEDAAVIFDAVMQLPPDAWLLLVKHARSGTRPEWWPEGPGEWVVPLDKQGRPKRLWRDPSRRLGDLGPAPAVLVGIEPTMVEADRAAYGLWHIAMCDLVPMVNSEMVEHEATGPAAHPIPWRETGGHTEPVSGRKRGEGGG